MDWGQLAIVLGAALGGGGFLTAWISGRTTRKIEEAKVVAEHNKADLDDQKQKLDRLQSMSDNLIANLQAENDRKDKRIEFLENKIATLEGAPPRRASRARKDTQ